MWISKQISDACKLLRNTKIGKVTSTLGNTVTVQAEQEHRQNAELEPGELMLYSSGGANIVLKNDGQVLINGTSIE